MVLFFRKGRCNSLPFFIFKNIWIKVWKYGNWILGLHSTYIKKSLFEVREQTIEIISFRK